MYLRPLTCALVAVALTTGCDGGTAVSGDSARLAPVPTAVGCADAPALRERAADDRRRSRESKSDQRKVSIGGRANFFASLAIIADLKCKVTADEADAALGPALETARRAEAASSFYEAAYRWSEAYFIATQVVSLLIQQLQAPASK